MSTNPLRPDFNRANQIKSNTGDLKQSITLFDIDYAIMNYLENTVLPTLSNNGEALQIPVIYGNSERWNGARKEGVYRDQKGKLQLPLMMIKRTSVAKDETMPFLKRGVSYQTISKYSKDNRYDKFSLFNNQQKPKKELYKITMPEFVDVNYECMAWTGYIEQLNEIIEQLNFTGQYWGDKDRFKFRTQVADYNIVNEVGDGTERINRVEFTLAVKAYLLPESFDGESPIKKSFSTKRIVVATETDVTGNGRIEGMLTTPSPYYDNKDLIDFLSINNTKTINGGTNTATFTSIKLIQTPYQLASVVTSGLNYGGNVYDVKLYINGVRYYQTTHFTIVVSNNQLDITFLPGNLGFSVSNTDEIIITGKFIDII
jgi:hypothetical protein